uniref:mitogen-activated protein kinase kinase n=1 Tax=Bicosoecida sp. CB-2014 TaxID=1486930 RepID=A0A7S1CE06_9STRA|mmetsp:Transcript_20637/g.72871  ORF Transcript_20637/g.72871 Transcript_20637/m.72871 type:complete len:361 (+) Transcript_20637:54-1136(+)|eukprot:CAMPEP_0203816448 /NCGR_PEP_ID=MMETSP0115-20131106/15288_1 /ASSEMBLY_ACC=CAM_ASM_000227 /TAXON_ID=33651 /ORGANISM="Bicosoecid sp, Strain ms1" /LENGTH=360 /DNA_ID=CAMNT_0050725353 /DNA_START=53 /DNA_END=1135 /DNA_ORIENTATION=-
MPPKPRRKPPALSITVGVKKQDSSVDLMVAESFESGDMKVTPEGVSMDSREATFDGIPYEQLEVLHDIGRGASSVVKHARHVATGEQYAVKCISLWDKSKRDQLIREIQALYSSDCAALVQFYGATFREGMVAVTLEYMDLGGLDNVIKHFGPPPEKTLACMAFQVLWGLAYLKHEHRVHRDIKPQNILVNSLGEVKLTDFGISKDLQASIMCKTFVGSFKYMSPERMAHTGYDYSSDVWSLGIVLLECATGVYPYAESDAIIDYVNIVTEGDAPKPPEGKFTPEFSEFIGQCVHKDPAERLPAEVLLGSPWLLMHGAEDLDSAVAVVCDWIASKDVERASIERQLREAQAKEEAEAEEK